MYIYIICTYSYSINFITSSHRIISSLVAILKRTMEKPTQFNDLIMTRGQGFQPFD